MKRITTSVDPATYAALEDLAQRDGVSTSHLLREAMGRYVTERERALEPGPLPDWVGTFESDGSPFAEHDEAILDDLWATDLGADVAPPAAPDPAASAPAPGSPTRRSAR